MATTFDITIINGQMRQLVDDSKSARDNAVKNINYITQYPTKDTE